MIMMIMFMINIKILIIIIKIKSWDGDKGFIVFRAPLFVLGIKIYKIIINRNEIYNLL